MLLTTEQVATELCTTAYTIRKYIRNGVLTASQIGKSYLIEKGEVERVLAEMRAPKKSARRYSSDNA